MTWIDPAVPVGRVQQTPPSLNILGAGQAVLRCNLFTPWVRLTLCLFCGAPKFCLMFPSSSSVLTGLEEKHFI